MINPQAVFKVILLWFLFGSFTCLFFAPFLHANTIDDVRAVRAIVGEAAGEPYIGKVALAEAIRNRGHLGGVYGYKRTDFIAKQPKKVFEDALKAWEKSKTTNLVNGADHWESIDFPRPWWAAGAIETARIGKHVFYTAVNS